jgi:hypothetical protein
MDIEGSWCDFAVLEVRISLLEYNADKQRGKITAGYNRNKNEIWNGAN